MNSLIKEKWVAALRSGEYKQSKKQLCSDNGFCCLGVLCDLYLKENGLDWQYDSQYGAYYMDDFNNSDRAKHFKLPPTCVRDWSDLSSYQTRVEHPNIDTQFSLYALNDELNFDFNEIADVIERDF